MNKICSIELEQEKREDILVKHHNCAHSNKQSLELFKLANK